MQLDTTDHKIILDALYHLATSDEPNLSEDVSALDDDDLEHRLLHLRQTFTRELHKRQYNKPRQ